MAIIINGATLGSVEALKAGEKWRSMANKSGAALWRNQLAAAA